MMSQSSVTESDSKSILHGIFCQLHKLEAKASETEQELQASNVLVRKLQDENLRLKELQNSTSRRYSDTLSALDKTKHELSQQNMMNNSLKIDNGNLRTLLSSEVSLSASRLEMCEKQATTILKQTAILKNHRHRVAALQSIWERIKCNTSGSQNSGNRNYEDTSVEEVRNLGKSLSRSLRRPTHKSRTRVSDKSDTFALVSQIESPVKRSADKKFPFKEDRTRESEEDPIHGSQQEFSQNLPSMRTKIVPQNDNIMSHHIDTDSVDNLYETVQRHVSFDEQDNMSPHLQIESFTENCSETLPPSPEFKTNFSYLRSDRKRKENDSPQNGVCCIDKRLLLSPGKQESTDSAIMISTSVRKSETPTEKTQSLHQCEITGKHVESSKQTARPESENCSSQLSEFQDDKHRIGFNSGTFNDVKGCAAINMAHWELDLPDTQTDPQQRHLRDCPTNSKKPNIAEDSETQPLTLGDHIVMIDNKATYIPNKTTGWIKI